MSLSPKQREFLQKSLELTREEEMDCDTFVEHLATFVDGLLPGELDEVFDHHRQLCPECEEELQALAEAVGRALKNAT